MPSGNWVTMRLSRRQLVKSAVPATGLLTAGNWSSAMASLRDVHRGGVPRVALSQFPATFTPAVATTWDVAWVSSLIHDRPLAITGDGEIVAGMVVSILLADDGASILLTIRNGVFFADGRLMTAADVAWSIRRAAECALHEDAWRWSWFDTAEEVDDNRVLVRMRQTDATLTATMASALVPVVPEQATIEDHDFAQLPPGSGPFVPTSDDGSTLRLRRNRWHWVVGHPRFDGVEVIATEQEITRTTNLVTGLVDIVPDVPALDIPLLQEDSRIALFGEVSRRLCAVAFRLDRAPLDDARVRTLVAAAIDRMSLAKSATADTGRAATWLFPPEHWAGPLEPAPVDQEPPADVRDQFAELGLLPGWSLRMVCPEQEAGLANAAILLQEQLANAGVALHIDLLDPEAMDAATASGDFDLAMVTLPPWTDPHELAYPWLHSDGPRNISAYRSMRMDRTLDLARGILDRDQRGALYRDVQRLVASEVPLVPLFATPWYDAVKARIEGYRQAPPASANGLSGAWFGYP